MTEYRPRLFFTQSVGHNPTATDTSAFKAYRILQLAEAHDTMIVEDDAFADLRPRSLTRIATLDQLRRTIYIGSFSKSVSAALRVGFLACNASLASDLADVKMLIHVSSSEYCERTLDAIVSDGHFLRHTNQIQEKLRRATESATRALKKLGADIFKESDQSLYLWAALPEWPDSMKLAQALLERSVTLAPGAVFSPVRQRFARGCAIDPSPSCPSCGHSMPCSYSPAPCSLRADMAQRFCSRCISGPPAAMISTPGSRWRRP
jgi:DNA-binding transcriptional MocR family regulator